MHNKLVIYRLGSLGDTVIALPIFHAIARAFPDHERIVLTNFPVASNAAPLLSILQDSGLVDSVIRYPVGLRSFKELFALRTTLLSAGAQTMVYLAAPRGVRACYRDLLFFRACGFRRIIGAPTTKDLQTNRIGADGSEEPEYLRLSRCVAELGPIDFDDPAGWDMRLTAMELINGREAIAAFGQRPFLAINMGGKAREKDWGVENWVQLLKVLGTLMSGVGLFVVGAAEDTARAEGVTSIWPGPTVLACGTLTPRECGAALARASLFIGHDSGPLHLASVMGTPSIGLFGDYNKPRKWHPASKQTQIIHQMSGVSAISVLSVLDVVRRSLSTTSLAMLNTAANP